QPSVLEQLDPDQGGISDRNDLVVIAMQQKHRHIDRLQVFGEVGLRKGLDAVVVSLDPTLHPLAPPVPDNALDRLNTRSVEAVERTLSDIEIKLGTVGGEASAILVEHLDRQAPGIAFALEHDRRDGADQHRPWDSARGGGGREKG